MENQNFDLETRVREIIRQLLDPVLRKTDECVKNIENTVYMYEETKILYQKCDHRQEILDKNQTYSLDNNEKMSYTVSDIQSDLDRIKTENFESQIQRDQELKKLKQEIFNRDDQIVALREQFENLSFNFNQISLSMQENGNKIIQNQNQLIQEYSSKQKEMEKQFGQFKELFHTDGSAQIYHQLIFDDLANNLQLFVAERHQTKQSVEDILQLCDQKVELIQFKENTFRIEKEIYTFQEKINHQVKENSAQIYQSFNDFIKEFNYIRDLMDKNHSIILDNKQQMEDLKQQLDIQEQKSSTEFDAVKKYQQVQDKDSYNLKEVQRKQLLDLNELKNYISKAFQQQFQDFDKFKIQTGINIIDTVESQLEQYQKLQQKTFNRMIRDNQSVIIKEEIEKVIDPKTQEMAQQITDSQLLNQTQIENLKLNIEEQIMNLSSVKFNQKPGQNYQTFDGQMTTYGKIQNIVVQNESQVIEEKESGIEKMKDFFGKEDIIKNIVIQQINQLFKRKLEENIEYISFLVSRDSKNVPSAQMDLNLHDVIEQVDKIESIKQQLQSDMQRYQQDNQTFNEKFDKYYYKVVQVQSDMTLQEEHNLNHLKNNQKERDEMLNRLKQMNQLIGMQSEVLNILLSLSMVEIKDQRNGKIQDPETFRFFSLEDGLVFDLFRQDKLKRKEYINYRGYSFDKLEILKLAFMTKIQVWNEERGEDQKIIQSHSPGKIFQKFIFGKIEREDLSDSEVFLRKQKPISLMQMTQPHPPKEQKLRQSMDLNKIKQTAPFTTPYITQRDKKFTSKEKELNKIIGTQQSIVLKGSRLTTVRKVIEAEQNFRHKKGSNSFSVRRPDTALNQFHDNYFE